MSGKEKDWVIEIIYVAVRAYVKDTPLEPWTPFGTNLCGQDES